MLAANSSPRPGQRAPRHYFMRAVVQLMGSLDLPSVLQEFVNQACKLTGASHGALSVLDNRGETSSFFHHGLPKDSQPIDGKLPVPDYLVAQIPPEGTVILNDLPNSMLPNECEGPTHRPSSFMGTPLRIHEQIYGRLFLCDKPSGFTDADAEDVSGIAAIASIAVENSRLYAKARNREKWMRASQKLTTLLLEGQDEEEALSLIINTVRDVADADTAIMVLPSVGDSWAAEIVEGAYSHELLGSVFPQDGRALSVLREGRGLLVDAMNRTPTLRIPQMGSFGPALYAPLMARGDGIGVLILLRLPNREEFDAIQLAQAESLASQAALALELAGAQHAEDVAALFDERNRIGQDLHDLAIQQLFATGMELDRIRQEIVEGTSGPEQMIGGLDKALAAVDDSVRQIRTIVHNLREPDQSVELVERLRREASLARTSLGIAPSFIIDYNGVTLVREDMEWQFEAVQLIEDAVSPDLADDVVAVVREALSNTARHAHASSVSVRVDIAPQPNKNISAFHEPHVVINVDDDGRGMDPRQHRRSGLNNLAARARRHRGWSEITSDSSGTSLFWCALL